MYHSGKTEPIYKGKKADSGKFEPKAGRNEPQIRKSRTTIRENLNSEKE